MFGKRKQDQKHLAELPDEPRREPEDPELVEALIELGRNRNAPLPQPDPAAEPGTTEASEADGSAGATGAGEPGAGEAEADETGAGEAEAGDELDQPLEPPLPDELDERWKPPTADTPSAPAWTAVPTAGMLAEPEPEPEPDADLEQPSAGAMAMPPPNRDGGTSAQLETALRRAQDESAGLKAQLEELRAELARRTERETESHDADAKASELAAELDAARADAAAAGVALERLERESKDREVALAVAEERAERLAGEIQQLRATSARAAQAESRQRDTEHDEALRTTVEENRRLAGELAANLQSQESLIAALTGLQTEVTEQRVWFEAQLANVRQMEGEQSSVVEALQAAVRERDAELEALRQQLLDVEAKRAEEAAAFVAALDRQ